MRIKRNCRSEQELKNSDTYDGGNEHEQVLHKISVRVGNQTWGDVLQSCHRCMSNRMSERNIFKREPYDKLRHNKLKNKHTCTHTPTNTSSKPSLATASLQNQYRRTCFSWTQKWSHAVAAIAYARLTQTQYKLPLSNGNAFHFLLSLNCHPCRFRMIRTEVDMLLFFLWESCVCVCVEKSYV